MKVELDVLMMTVYIKIYVKEVIKILITALFGGSHFSRKTLDILHLIGQFSS